MSNSTKRRPSIQPAPASAPPVSPPIVAEETSLSSPPVYRGDRYGLMIWFGGAMILAALHVIDVVYWWFHR